MQQSRETESKTLTIKDEEFFFSLLEERMEQQGFELLETIPPLTQSLASADLT